MASAIKVSTHKPLPTCVDGIETNLTEVVDRYAPLVKRIAHHLLLPIPASVQIDDLIQSAMIGLLSAAK